MLHFAYLQYVELSKDIRIKVSRNIIFPVVSYVCETLYLISMEEHRLRVFENGVLRRIFGPMRDEIIAG
jgi:hypothetical protein